MSESQLNVLAVIGSLHRTSASQAIVRLAATQLEAAGVRVDVLDFANEPLPLFNPDTAYAAPGYPALKARVEAADVILIGTPDYHGSLSSATKNFLDHFWREFAGKLFVSLVASYEKGLTVTDQLRTVARQCYAWSLPYGVSFVEGQDFKNGEIINAAFQARFDMCLRDTRVYGQLLSAQRRADLAATDPCFLAKLRA